MKMFYDWLGPKKAKGIRLAVMDMWKPFRNATNEHAPQAAILFDKFHVMRQTTEQGGDGKQRQMRGCRAEGVTAAV